MLKAHGVDKGDRVTIYLPMIPEAAYAMLACARIGADPFGRVRRLLAGLRSPGRIEGCKSKLVITADEGLRGGRKVPLKINADAARQEDRRHRQDVLVVRRTGGTVAWTRGPRRLVRRGAREGRRRIARASR